MKGKSLFVVPSGEGHIINRTSHIDHIRKNVKKADADKCAAHKAKNA